MKIETKRLIITQFSEDMAEAVHLNSLDDDIRRFVPDEVFETLEEARETVCFLISRYGTEEGPFVYPLLLRQTGENIGYVQAVRIEDGWEVGYLIAKAHRGQGYASEALLAFLPVILKQLGISKISGICLTENLASRRVLEKCGFLLCWQGPGNYQDATRDICRYSFSLPEGK